MIEFGIAGSHCDSWRGRFFIYICIDADIQMGDDIFEQTQVDIANRNN